MALLADAAPACEEPVPDDFGHDRRNVDDFSLAVQRTAG